MASASDIAIVRRNVNESTDVTFDDAYLSGLIDTHGVAGASAIIWREKAARFAELVNTSEAGASHSYSDLHKAALTMSKTYDAEATEIVAPVAYGIRVRRIVRS